MIWFDLSAYISKSERLIRNSAEGNIFEETAELLFTAPQRLDGTLFGSGIPEHCHQLTGWQFEYVVLNQQFQPLITIAANRTAKRLNPKAPASVSICPASERRARLLVRRPPTISATMKAKVMEKTMVSSRAPRPPGCLSIFSLILVSS